MIQDNSKVRTVNHEDIKSWAEARNVRPTGLRRFSQENLQDRLRFRFPDERFPDEDDLEWDTFFDIFDTSELEFVFEDIADEAVEEGNIYQFEPRRY